MIYFIIGVICLVVVVVLLFMYEQHKNKKIAETRDPNDLKIFNTVIDVLKHRPELIHDHDGEYYECTQYGFIITECLYGDSAPSITPNIKTTSSEDAELSVALDLYKHDVRIKAEVAAKKIEDVMKKSTLKKIDEKEF